jgi:hypothetical protein
MTAVVIKRRGLGDIVQGYVPDTEKCRDAKVEGDLLIKDEILDRVMDKVRFFPNGRHFVGDIDVVLTPEQIDLVTLYCTVHASEAVGEIAAKLIQKSFDNRHNDFYLRLPGTTRLGRLTGEKGRLIEIDYHGDMQTGGQESKWIDLRIHGDVSDRLGLYARYSRFYVSGNAGKHGATCARESIFVVEDYIGSFGYHSLFCHFKTSNPLTLKKMLQEDKETYRSISFINNGVEEYLGTH